jgi:hypothetical protein
LCLQEACVPSLGTIRDSLHQLRLRHLKLLLDTHQCIRAYDKQPRYLLRVCHLSRCLKLLPGGS